MTKKLLVQIKNEWRNNLWLALELLVVSVVMWFVVDYLYTRAATYLSLIHISEPTRLLSAYAAVRKLRR